MNPPTPRVVALSGGIGGTKLALGLMAEIGDGGLTVIANPGDDFEHLGLTLWPDFDTLLYTLGGRADAQRGWGRRDETWTFMGALAELGGETWFALGDGDLALHVERTRRLGSGERATSIARALTRRYEIDADLLPVSDTPVRTRVLTGDGALDFQHYFVRDACEPVVTGFELDGLARAHPTPEVVAALRAPTLEAVVICPSNPFISIDPIVEVPGMRALLRDCAAPVVAVSPIVGGEAIKGPTAKMMVELGLEVSARTVVDHYRPLLDGFVLDDADASLGDHLGLPCEVAPTIMRDTESKRALARRVLDFTSRLRTAG